ncbi:hypothetical protein ACF3MZ_06825 [Paenibacillaceae bacterium WGS1546]|uniref:hypothetical protein n=1 Tax=Cohnella sp. WGS1546 TaxID=3366810 RepID=UPI00372D750F
MDKRLNRSDLMFSLAFLLMLVIAIGAFFYGVKVGTDRAEAKHAALQPRVADAEAPPSAYQQQDLVSFYHTVFLSYREFHDDWLDARNKWLSDPSADRSSSMKELAKIAKRKYEEVQSVYIAPISPQLINAQTDYLKSLKLFEESFASLASSANESTAAKTLEKIESDSFFKEGKLHSLNAQKEYYDSMLRWAGSVDMDVPVDYDSPDVLAIAEWNTLPLIVKLKVASDYMSEQGELTDYLPHDLTAKIDQFIQSGQADKRKVKSVNAVAELLTSTEAVGAGYFNEVKSRFYANEHLPQLPFFS